MLRGVLLAVYFAHYSLLVEAIHLLSSLRVSSTDVNTAETYLTAFCKSYMISKVSAIQGPPLTN